MIALVLVAALLLVAVPAAGVVHENEVLQAGDEIQPPSLAVRVEVNSNAGPKGANPRKD